MTFQAKISPKTIWQKNYLTERHLGPVS